MPLWGGGLPTPEKSFHVILKLMYWPPSTPLSGGRPRPERPPLPLTALFPGRPEHRCEIWSPCITRSIPFLASHPGSMATSILPLFTHLCSWCS